MTPPPASRRHPLRPVPGIGRAAGLSGLANLCGIALTATSGWLIVKASYQPVVLTLLVAIVGVRAFGMGRPVFRYAERLVSHDVALRDLAQRRADVYRHLVPLTPARLGRRGRSEVLTGVVRDLDDEVMAQIRVLVPLIGTLLASLVTVAVVAWLLPLAGLVVALGGLAAIAVAWLDLALESAGQRRGVAARAEVGRVATLVTTNAAELQAVGAQDDALAWLRTAHDDVRRGAAGQALGRAVGTGLTTLVTAATTVVTGLVAAAAYRDGTLDGPVAALVTLAPLALGDALATLPDALGSWARARAASRRLGDLLSRTPAVAGDPDAALPDGTDATAPVAIGADAVSATWAGTRTDLPPTDLDLPPGTHLAVVGPNGSGKSTLLAVLARHLDPASGTYRQGDDDALALPLGGGRSRIAVLDDEPHVLSTSLRENLRLARPGCDDAQIEEALAAAGLAGWLRELPDGLDTLLGAGHRGISGGERARLALARVVLSRRPVWLLDEPLAHLDHATAVAVLRDCLDSARDLGASVVVVSHQVDETAHLRQLTPGRNDQEPRTSSASTVT